jgi:ABC-type branched-subunit amino acid transport system substrate-binding protein
MAAMRWPGAEALAHAGRLVALLLLPALAAAATGSGALTSDEQAGESIYRRGESASGARLTARVGTLELEGPALACRNCHGDDGRGRREGGVATADIRWSELSKPWGHRHDGGREHGAFDEAALARALLEGRDPSGNRLAPAMPRYAMSLRDQAALVAYLKRLDELPMAGVKADRLRIGSWWPPELGANETQRTLVRAWQARFDAVNRAGGIHGRRLELVTPASLPAHTPAESMVAWAARADVLLLLGPWVAGHEEQLGEAARQAELPVLAPQGLFADDVSRGEMSVFHLVPGAGSLALALVRHVADIVDLRAQPMLLLHASGAAGLAAAQRVAVALQQQGWTPPRLRGLAAEDLKHLDALAADLAGQPVAGLVSLVPGLDLVRLARAGQALGWQPRAWLVPGPLAPRELLPAVEALAGRTWLAYPGAPLWAAVPSSGASAAQRVPAAPLVAVDLLIEVLKRSGRELDRARVLQVLETVQGYQPEGWPAISFSAARRLSSGQARLLALERSGLRHEPPTPLDP